MPTVSPPAIVLPEHRWEIDALRDHYRQRYADHPRIADFLRVMDATTVRTRHVSRPLAALSDPENPVDGRLESHFADTCGLAEQAAHAALRKAGVQATEVNGLVCVSVTGYNMPGPDAELANRLGLPPTVRRLPVVQMGCNGGAFALARAAEMCANGLDNVLLVAADLFLPYIHPGDTGMDAMIFRALMGDAAGACVVRRDETGPGLRIFDSWDYTAPDTTDIVGTRVRSDGMHIFNSPRLYDALGKALPELLRWFREGPADGAADVLSFLVAHPGGPKVMNALQDGLQVAPELVDVSRASLRSLGNAGSVSILDVLSRIYAAPPPRGALGLTVGIGPGVTATASRVRWQ
ncbi:hypothetical protein [Streptomyces sp. NBC_01477]|uniref:hypothetical protein n=1 Tax=Streptomyces sp. NBC_01477 TaxID=2976015 RepID=UPI002E371DD6|nr:hypothetical protein [Streptomyces sp. NBC_01477]